MNSPARQQQTIGSPARIRGTGYWTGQSVTVEFRPAAPNTGIVFVRRDLQPARRIAAISTNAIDTPRRTTITAHGGTVEMIEHLMAALRGLQIDNCEVVVDAAEMPACDGSSEAVTEALTLAGVVSQEALCDTFVVLDPIRVGDDQAWIEALPPERPGLSVRYHLEYSAHSAIGCQIFETAITPETFRVELAAARTFVTEEEARRMQLSGIGATVKWSDILVFGDSGPVGNKLRFADECARHKVLDIVGDLALAGFEIHGQIRAYRSGHRLNGELVRALVSQKASSFRQSA